MLFNSYEYIFLFLPITYLIYFWLNKNKLTELSKGFIVLASLLFYSWWNVIYLPLILGSMLFNYFVGESLSRKRRKNQGYRRKLLTFGIIVNVGMLIYFKYADFFIVNLNAISKLNVQLLNIALPLAISFFTFQQIAYLVDSYRNDSEEYSFLNYAVFVTFFPQLIAGPIVHHKEMMPQFANIRNQVKNYRNISLGMLIFSIGLFKKVVIADTFSIWAVSGFDMSETLGFFEAWATSISYTFQLYFDFSGYTDMAVGSALIFNIKLPINFNSPYKALNIQDFWKRWHMTLSRFLRDYIYIPLGGSRTGHFATYRNLMVTFLIGGLWHGAGWTFVFWGFLHGVALVINRIWQKFGIKINKIISWFITFNFINIAWIFFRANEWKDAIKILVGMFNFDEYYNLNYMELTIIILGFIIVLFTKNSMYYLKVKFEYTFKNISVFVFLSTISILAIRLGSNSEFLYFNF